MTLLLSTALNITLIMLGAALILTCYRLIKGPTLPDRVVALDMISSLVVGMIAAYCILEHDSLYLRDAVVLAVVSFLGTTAFAYYVGKGGLP